MRVRSGQDRLCPRHRRQERPRRASDRGLSSTSRRSSARSTQMTGTSRSMSACTRCRRRSSRSGCSTGKRVDGRTPDEIRPLDAEVGVLPRVHGSGLFTRGQTQVLSVCTLNTLSAAQKLDTIYDETEQALYPPLQHARRAPPARPVAAAPPPAVRLATARWQKRRCCRCCPSVDEFPYAIRVVSPRSCPPTARPLRPPSAAPPWR